MTLKQHSMILSVKNAQDSESKIFKLKVWLMTTFKKDFFKNLKH